MKLISCLLLIFIAVYNLKAQVVHQIYFDRFTHYTIDDWITYAPALEVSTIDVGDEYIYLGTRGGGILRYNVYENLWDYPFTTSSGLSSNRINYVVYDFPGNKLYAQTNKGTDVYNRAFNYWEPAPNIELPNRRRPSQADLNDYSERKNFNFPEFYRPPNLELPDFFTDTDYLFRPPNEVLDKNNRIFRLKNDRVVDNWRNIWFGTDGLGVGKANLNNYNLTFYQQSISNIEPRDLLFDDNDVWVVGLAHGKEPAGINIWDLDQDRWEYHEARFNFGIYDDNCFTVSTNGKYIFCGSDQGIIKYDKKKRQWKTFTTGDGLESNTINHLYFWGKTLFIATDEGFNWMLSDYNQIEESIDNSLDNVPVYRITGTDSTVLFATRDGIYQYWPENDEVRFLNTASANLDLYVSAININNDTLWVAGEYGISYHDPKKDRWKSFTQIKNRIPGKIYDIAFSEDHVWFASNNGLLKYDKKRDYWYLYTEKDGLANKNVYKIVPDNDDLWLCTKGGVTIFRWFRPGRVE